MNTLLSADIRSTFTSEDTQANGLGWNPPQVWQATHDTLRRLKVMERAANPVTSLYTNAFLK